jgi:preprotein translocase SecE subunit
MSADEAVEGKSKRRRKRRSENENGTDENESLAEERGVTDRKGRATPGKRNKEGAVTSGSEGGNIITRPIGGIRGYVKGVSDEMRKVLWPNRTELTSLLRIVLTVTIMSSITLGILTAFFTEITNIGIGQRHPEVFVVLFAAVGVSYFLFTRMSSSTDDQTPY